MAAATWLRPVSQDRPAATTPCSIRYATGPPTQETPLSDASPRQTRQLPLPPATGPIETSRSARRLPGGSQAVDLRCASAEPRVRRSGAQARLLEAACCYGPEVLRRGQLQDAESAAI